MRNGLVDVGDAQRLAERREGRLPHVVRVLALEQVDVDGGRKALGEALDEGHTVRRLQVLDQLGAPAGAGVGDGDEGVPSPLDAHRRAGERLVEARLGRAERVDALGDHLAVVQVLERRADGLRRVLGDGVRRAPAPDGGRAADGHAQAPGEAGDQVVEKADAGVRRERGVVPRSRR